MLKGKQFVILKAQQTGEMLSYLPSSQHIIIFIYRTVASGTVVKQSLISQYKMLLDPYSNPSYVASQR